MEGYSRITGDCLNAAFQGHFAPDSLEEDQTLTGTGLVLDDDLNLFISQWKDN